MDLTTLATSTKDKAYEIIKAKGATYYGIGAVTSSICESILFNQLHVRPLSHWQEDLQVYLSLPAVLGRGGVEKTMEIPLNEEEKQKLDVSAQAIRDIVDEAETRKES